MAREIEAEKNTKVKQRKGRQKMRKKGNERDPTTSFCLGDKNRAISWR